MKFGFEGDSIRSVSSISSELREIRSFLFLFDDITSSFWCSWICSSVSENGFGIDEVFVFLSIKIMFWKLWDSYDKFVKLLSFHFGFEHFKMMINEENVFDFLIFRPFSFNYIASLWVFWFFLTTLQIFWMWIAGYILDLGVIGLFDFRFDLLAFRILHWKKILLITEI